MNKLTDYLYVCKNIICEELCDNIIKFHLEENKWYEHSYNNFHEKGIKYGKELLNDALNERFTDRYCSTISKALNVYAERYFKITKLPPPIINGMSVPRINRYVEGTKMKLHFDNITSLFAKDVGSPILTVLGCLNDKTEYSGGELFIFGDLQVECDKGDVIIFPSAFMYPHEVKEVIKGERWSIVNWTI